MTEKKLKQLLSQADFSAGTDLKQRLREQLFGSTVRQFPARRVLNDDDLAGLFAAGDAQPTDPDQPKNPT